MPGGTTSDAAAERERRILDVIRMLAEGEVTTYGDVAEDAGFPRQSRLVGRLLSQRSDSHDLPWWRVVNAAGRLVPGNEREQALLLKAEGVTTANGRVTDAPHGRFRRTRR